jgi:hypothetical protein
MRYVHEIQNIYKAEGVIGFTRGYGPLLMRDVPGMGVYFSSWYFVRYSMLI